MYVLHHNRRSISSLRGLAQVHCAREQCQEGLTEGLVQAVQEPHERCCLMASSLTGVAATRFWSATRSLSNMFVVGCSWSCQIMINYGDNWRILWDSGQPCPHTFFSKDKSQNLITRPTFSECRSSFMAQHSGLESS